jgi:hypothetical protein
MHMQAQHKVPTEKQNQKGNRATDTVIGGGVTPWNAHARPMKMKQGITWQQHIMMPLATISAQ